MDILNIFNLTLDARKDVDPVATLHTILFSWDTCDSFVLPLLKTNFVDYVECVILVKYVTKTKKVHRNWKNHPQVFNQKGR